MGALVTIEQRLSAIQSIDATTLVCLFFLLHAVMKRGVLLRCANLQLPQKWNETELRELGSSDSHAASGSWNEVLKGGLAARGEVQVFNVEPTITNWTETCFLSGTHLTRMLAVWTGYWSNDPVSTAHINLGWSVSYSSTSTCSRFAFDNAGSI